MTDAIAPRSHSPAHALERLVFFSDAVFAIAITLLVIEIHVPEVHAPRDDHAFLEALAGLAPHFVSFFISFFVIGAFWAGHHRAFDCARHWDPRLLLPNLCLLASVAAMPFVTAFASEYPGYRVPVALYCAWMVLMATLNIWVQRIATAPPVTDETVPHARRDMIRVRGLAVLCGATFAFVVSLIAPYFGQMALVTMPLWRMLLLRIWPVR